ncbi:MAG: rhodanese-like domain-containing protein [Sandaracinus sp.]|nr:rhodanese-like domain-containing protein [Myxococcales bacterium]MCB9600077.1 rhodanese-like domain-containing protein [Sandaracinus sp.]MCB9618510.1 rhodanese-like domain-containing protein [Sandaracinus sp.]MCB9622072.1 rhodanese-like domain-containing protein [Sandaracinus sp.]MCB9630637.1 rhodanese-like domain-containing protein [Sandaracinus sp.]
MRSFLRRLSIVLVVGLAVAGAVVVAQPRVAWDGLKATIEARHPEVPWVTGETLASWLGREPAPLLLDARTEAEFRVSHLEGALRVDPERPDVARLPRPSAGRKVVVYCSVGWRSGDVAAVLRQAGWREVYNLEGGLFAWANAGRAVVGEGAPKVHPFDATWGRLLVAERRAPLE